MSPTSPKRFRLEIAAEPSDVPVIVRLRKLLKLAHRACQMRCVRIVVLEESSQDDERQTNQQEHRTRPD